MPADRSLVASLLVGVGAVALLLAGLALAVSLGLARADRLFDQLSRSQAQLALATRIEADLALLLVATPETRAMQARQLSRRLVAYTQSIDAEGALQKSAIDRTWQAAERARAQAIVRRIYALNLSGVTDRNTTLAPVAALIARQVAGERAEVAEATADMRTLRRDLTRLAIIGAIAALALLALALHAAIVGVVQPLRRLSKAAIAVGRGSPPKAASAAGRFGEVRALGRALDTMATQITDQQHALAGANQRLEADVAARTAELAAGHARLADIDRNRRHFFAQVGHELKTPITVIRCEAEIALREPGAPLERLHDALRHVVASSDFLDRRLADLLALARAEDGKLGIVTQIVDLAEVTATAVTLAEPFATASDITLTLTTSPATIRGDASWIAQALLALIDNAVKVSRSRIAISLHVTGHRAHISVADDGPGVAPADLPRLGDRFYQTDDGRSRGGSGLGLSVARWVAEQHGGTMAADNGVDGGLIVTLALPMEKPSEVRAR